MTYDQHWNSYKHQQELERREKEYMRKHELTKPPAYAPPPEIATIIGRSAAVHDMDSYYIECARAGL